MNSLRFSYHQGNRVDITQKSGINHPSSLLNNMHRYLIIWLCLFSLPIPVWATPLTPPELAQRIIQAMQNGQSAQFTPAIIATNITILRNALPNYPHDAGIPFALGSCYLAQNNAEAGEHALAQAYALSPRDPLISMTYVIALKSDKKLLQAQQVAAQISAANPDVPQFQILLATLDQTIQKYDESAAIINSLLAKAPANLAPQDKGSLMFLLGVSYLHQGKTSDAVKTLEAANGLNPHAAMILCSLAEAAVKNGEVAKARDSLDESMTINPKIPAALYYKGVLLERAGAPAKARQYFQACYDQSKLLSLENGEDYFRLSLVCARLNKPDEARKYQTQAAQLFYTADAPWAVK
jgi:tetratricopeptide (TPR) repeat protein